MYLFDIVQKNLSILGKPHPSSRTKKKDKKKRWFWCRTCSVIEKLCNIILSHSQNTTYIHLSTYSQVYKYTLLFSINFTNVYSGKKSPLRCRSLIEKLHKHTLLHIHTIEIHSSHTNTSTHLYTYTHLHTQYTRVNTRHTRVKVLYSYATPMCGRIDVLECEV